jgi:hypothetical protein
VWTALTWLIPVAGSCEGDSETSGPIKCEGGNFFTMWATVLLKEDCAIWSCYYRHVVVVLLHLMMIIMTTVVKNCCSSSLPNEEVFDLLRSCRIGQALHWPLHLDCFWKVLYCVWCVAVKQYICVTDVHWVTSKGVLTLVFITFTQMSHRKK